MKTVTLTGLVTRFAGTGRKLGYPTANITTETQLAEGIYFGYADLAKYTNNPALLFIGVPTTMGEHDRRVEVHLLDIPDKDYYDQFLSVKIYYFHRPNKHFNDVAELLSVMRGDMNEARHWFIKNPLANRPKVSDT